MLAPHFARVVGSDASRAQLRQAERVPGVHYVAALAEASALCARSVDLITVAQAFHWLTPERFYAEVDRVAAPGAALALWGYGKVSCAPAIDAALSHFHEETVGPYWPLARKLVDRGYRGFEIPIAETPPPRLAIEAVMTLAELLGYLRTWSAVGRYQMARGQDPVALLQPELSRLWGDSQRRRRVRWPLFIRAVPWRGAR